MAENEKTAPTVPTAIGTEQLSQNDCTNRITENSEDCNTERYSYRDFLRKMTGSYYIHVMSLSKLYDIVYESKPPIIDGLLYPGVYLFVGAPTVGKSFLMPQLSASIRAAFLQIATLSFSDLELKALSLDESKAALGVGCG
ncbi:MAG: hypothetical protein ACI4KM_04110 [Oscillospiraceae bacterium]